MISYEDLCAALDRYAATHGRPAATTAAAAPVAAPVAVGAAAAPAPTLSRQAPATIADYSADDHTSVSTALPPEDDHEVELGDVLSDEESHH